jgi:cytochrome c oxidase cbb3-type subunit 2
VIIATIIVVSIAGLVQIVPLFFQHSTTEPDPGITPYSPLRLMGRDIYIREGCYNCHSQQVRTLQAETERYGHFSTAGESVYDHPFLWGSKRTGPDLARVGGRYSDDWQRIHLRNPRDVVPESVMPSYPWLEKTQLPTNDIQARMRANAGRAVHERLLVRLKSWRARRRRRAGGVSAGTWPESPQCAR